MKKRVFGVVCATVMVVCLLLGGCGMGGSKSKETTTYHLSRDGRYAAVEADIVLTKIDDTSYEIEYSGTDAFLEYQRHVTDDLSFSARMDYYNSIDGYDCYITTAPSTYGEDYWYLSQDGSALLIPVASHFNFVFKKVN